MNIPYLKQGEIKGVRICRMGISKFVERFERRLDLRNNSYYWQGGSMKVMDADHDADITYLNNGWITITPIRFDLTDKPFMQKLENWGFDLDI